MKPDFNKYKIIPAIIQNKKTKKILMQGWMNKESFDKTIETKKVWFFSITTSSTPILESGDGPKMTHPLTQNRRDPGRK